MARQKVDLVELMATRSVAHPSYILRALFADGALAVTAYGWPWWRPDQQAEEDRIDLTFSGISSGTLDLLDWTSPGFNEALEDFAVCETEGLDWAGPTSGSIYCSAPIPRPLDLYDRLEAYLLDQNALRQPRDFLNGANRLSRFISFVTSDTYMLGSGPAAVCDLLTEELRLQGVPFTFVEHQGVPEAPIFVRIGQHGFFCEKATAEFD